MNNLKTLPHTRSTASNFIRMSHTVRSAVSWCCCNKAFLFQRNDRTFSQAPFVTAIQEITALSETLFGERNERNVEKITRHGHLTTCCTVSRTRAAFAIQTGMRASWCARSTSETNRGDLVVSSGAFFPNLTRVESSCFRQSNLISTNVLKTKVQRGHTACHRGVRRLLPHNKEHPSKNSKRPSNLRLPDNQ